MRPRGHTTVACISLAGYLLAVAGAAVFHDHSHHEHHAAAVGAHESHGDACCHAEASHAGGCCHHHGHDHQPADTGDREHEHPSPDAPHDDCPICQFLALKILTSFAPATVAAPEGIEFAAAPPLPAVSIPEPWRPLSRGPPATA